MLEFLQQPVVMAFFSAHQMQFAAVAWIVILVRLCLRRVSRREGLLLAVFIGLIVVEFVQLAATQHAGVLMSDITRDQREGFPRYFNPMAPLLWGWAAWGLADLWRLANRRVRLAARVGIVLVLAYFLFGLVVPHFVAIQESSPGVDATVAARRIAPVIRQDYAGPSVREDFPYDEHEYLTARRPVVRSDFAAAAWFAKGEPGGANLGYYPYPEDYILLKMARVANRGMKDMNPDDFDYVARVKGTTHTWMLFRRKGTPHR